MSYHIYNTKGLVLAAWSYKEADRIYSILTREFGLVRAMALGVRKEASKLRGSLEPYSISTISLVKGKEFWRITSAQMIEKISPKPEIARPLALLEKLVQGEASHPELFDLVEREALKDERGEEFEMRFVGQILFELGYLKREDLNLNKKELISAINEGLKHSHLA